MVFNIKKKNSADLPSLYTPPQKSNIAPTTAPQPQPQQKQQPAPNNNNNINNNKLGESFFNGNQIRVGG